MATPLVAASRKRHTTMYLTMKLTNYLSTSSKIRLSLTDPAAASSARRNGKHSNEGSILLRNENLQRLLTTDDVAELLGIAPATLTWWRSQKCGPPFVRLGRGKRSPIRYRLDAVEAFIAEMESVPL